MSAKCQPETNPEHQGSGDTVECPDIGASLQQMIEGSATSCVEDQAKKLNTENDAEENAELRRKRLLRIYKRR